jgi:DNA-binding XRE family transcriptional regulator
MPDLPQTDAITPAAVVRPDTEAALRREVGRRLRFRRLWLRLSQDELAGRAQVTRNFVSAIERGAQGLDAWRRGRSPMFSASPSIGCSPARTRP